MKVQPIFSLATVTMTLTQNSKLVRFFSFSFLAMHFTKV
jgi:hypothetical protein